MDIPSSELKRQFCAHQKEYEEKAISVLRGGWYVLGKEVSAFESEFAGYIGTAECVGLASGLDALYLAFRALGITAGDEVIVQGNTYIASVIGITKNGATPVFVEPDEYFGIDVSKIEEKITDKTKAILMVHLYGQACDMESVCAIAKKHGLFVVEDCAQSHGAELNANMTGSMGDIGCFSFYPSKNLGAFGDGGAITTASAEIAQKIRVLRNYGSEKRYYNMVVGENSRLDELQAGLLRVKLKYLNEINAERERLCERYTAGIKNTKVTLPKIKQGAKCVWHQYVVRCEERDELQEFLLSKGVHTLIHYPVPPHLSEAYAYLGVKKGALPITEKYAETVLSLPLYNGMRDDEIDYVIEMINAF